MFALGILQTPLQCLTSRSMLWTGNSALPSVWRVYLHRFMLSWQYWGAAFAQGRPGGLWLSIRLTRTCPSLWKLTGFMGTTVPLANFAGELLLPKKRDSPSAWPEDTGWIQLEL